MKQNDLAQEVSEFIRSEEFKESGALDAEGDVDFGPASVAVASYIEELEEDEDDASGEGEAGSEK